ncbi:hypothetical protein DFH27DRAFT_186219 [Peziza echinospora]|nr:hypothetical protein DFH27DRAFT_186219 [Peziza echinospora]
MSALWTYACAAPECGCTRGVFHPQVRNDERVATDGPASIVFEDACATCGHGYAHHHSLDATSLEPDATAPTPRTPAKRRSPATHSHSTSHSYNNHTHSTPLKVSSLSGRSIDPSAAPPAKKRRQRAEHLAVTSGEATVHSKGNSSGATARLRAHLAEELDGNVFVDVDGVLDLFQIPGAPPDDTCTWWTDPPAQASDQAFVPWLVQMLGRARETGQPRGGSVWHDGRRRTMQSGFATVRRPDFCLLAGAAARADDWHWRLVEVVGEHRSAFLQLADYAAQVLAYQPLRLRAHGVLCDGHALRLFVFDRGGALGSRALPADAPTLAALGRTAPADPPVAGIPLMLPGAVRAVLTRTLCRRPGIVCRGTYCAVAIPDAGPPRAPLLVKLSWRSATRASEGALLQRAAQRRVVGVARHVHHADLVDLVALRGALAGAEGVPMALLAAGDRGSGGPVPAAFANRVYTYTILATIGKPVEHCTAPAQIAHGLLGGLVGHASLYFTGGLLHRDVSAANVLFSAADIPATAGSDADDTDTGAAASALPAAIAPAGLTSLHGFLIDLDYAVHVGDASPQAPSGAPHRTGTLPFMSIGVLMAEPHAYRHDLESFLYVLLWAICGGATAMPDWENGPPNTIAIFKRGQMTDTRNFEDLLRRAGQGFDGLKNVARAWRNILFCVAEDVEEGKLYDVRPARHGVVKRGLGEWDAMVLMRDVLWENVGDLELEPSDERS